ncbi:MAG TPA: DUF2796 domain-containing protein [Steroidobacteraceae bacterium]|nr:DUF2796 domain-containing protein [Steroidobacteraceae bacterium]HUA26617.1 DUF2796 domain-containing protein [Steroidobacteraceae bacterium]
MRSYGRAAALLALVLGCAAHSRVTAAEFRSRGVHEHGSATLDIALDGSTLDIALHSPAINVIGFEHEPRSPQEKAALAQANRVFGAPQGLFVLPEQAACASTGVTLTPITYEHDGEDEKAGAPHADYDVSYRFNCAHADHLDWIAVKLFGRMKGMRKITANVVTATLQTQVELTSDGTRIALRL